MQLDLISKLLIEDQFSRENLERLYDEKVSLNTAIGKDGVTQKSFRSKLKSEISLIITNVTNGKYNFTRYRERLILKGAAKPPRMISIPTIRDRLTLRATNETLTATFPEARSLRPHSYIKRIRAVLKEADDETVFVRMDVREFYPSVDHAILIKKVSKKLHEEAIVSLIERAISTPTGEAHENPRGVPQGLSISNILSSIYMTSIDETLSRKFIYFRYVDDILILAKRGDGEAAFKTVRQALGRLKLKCHDLGQQGKSQISPVADGIDYLGFHIRKNKISVRHSSFTRMMENILSVITEYRHNKRKRSALNRLIYRLNLKISGCIFDGERYGWMFFFSQADDISQFKRLDGFISKELIKNGLKEEILRVKTFTRAYHEIRFNLDQSKYIPKFDTVSVAEMIATLSVFEGISPEEVASRYSESDIRARFLKVLKRETKQLERDLIEAIS